MERYRKNREREEKDKGELKTEGNVEAEVLGAIGTKQLIKREEKQREIIERVRGEYRGQVVRRLLGVCKAFVRRPQVSIRSV